MVKAEPNNKFWTTFKIGFSTDRNDSQSRKLSKSDDLRCSNLLINFTINKTEQCHYIIVEPAVPNRPFSTPKLIYRTQACSQIILLSLILFRIIETGIIRIESLKSNHPLFYLSLRFEFTDQFSIYYLIRRKRSSDKSTHRPDSTTWRFCENKWCQK